LVFKNLQYMNNMSATFKTSYGGSATFTFYSFRQIAELCRNKAAWADMEIDFRDYFKKYLEVEKTWFERSKNPKYKKVIYAIERIFLVCEKYNNTTIQNADERFARFVRNICAVRTPRGSNPATEGNVRFRKSVLYEIDVEDSGEIGLREKYADAFREEERLYSSLWWAESSLRGDKSNVAQCRFRLKVASPKDSRKKEWTTELEEAEQSLKKAEAHSTKTHKAWIAQCRKIMKLAEGVET